MKATKLIEQLQKLVKERGDLPVSTISFTIVTGRGYNGYYIPMDWIEDPKEKED